jgi:hypothetical protein
MTYEVLDGTHTVSRQFHWRRLPQSARDAYKSFARGCGLPGISDKDVGLAFIAPHVGEKRYVLVTHCDVPKLVMVKHMDEWVIVPVPSAKHA